MTYQNLTIVKGFSSSKIKITSSYLNYPEQILATVEKNFIFHSIYFDFLLNVL